MNTKRRLAGACACIALAVPAAAALARPASTHRATIKEHEYGLVPSKVSVSHGTVTFTLKNTGKARHALAIEHGSASHTDLKSKGVNPGKSITFRVALHKGTFEIYCPIGGHKKLGMKGTLKVL